MARFHRLAKVTLAATVGVVLWGAYVRASGSGAGCGSHWPTCNGEVIPRAPRVETLIEYSHRLTSGIAFLLVVATVVVALRAFGPGHRVRKAAFAALALMITEALVGAGLVLFEMVADNPSIARGFWMSGHLANTFLLLAAQTLTVWWSRDGADAREEAAWPSGVALGVPVLLFATLLVGISGAVAALGDTLFPATSLGQGLADDLSASSHLMVRLRGLHPLFAVATAVGWLFLAGHVSRRGDVLGDTRRAATAVGGLVCLQVVVGIVNLVLLAPVWMQIIHLLLADLLWIQLIALSAQIAEGRPLGAAGSARQSSSARQVL